MNRSYWCFSIAAVAPEGLNCCSHSVTHTWSQPDASDIHLSVNTYLVATKRARNVLAGLETSGAVLVTGALFSREILTIDVALAFVHALEFLF